MCKQLFLFIAVFLSLNHAAGMWYVDKDNTAGPWDGLTWNSAFITVQEGVDAAFNDGGGGG